MVNVREREHWLQTLLRASAQIDYEISTTGHHSSRVAILTMMIARQLGFKERETHQLYWAGRLHDIGKVGIPSNVLAKVAPLNEQEWQLIKLHPTIGAHIIRTTQKVAKIAPIVLAHQEHYDGSGYPNGLSGEQIPLGGRILAVADSYDAMTNNRVYRKARQHKDAIHEIDSLAGCHYDPVIVKTFIGLF